MRRCPGEPPQPETAAAAARSQVPRGPRRTGEGQESRGQGHGEGRGDDGWGEREAGGGWGRRAAGPVFPETVSHLADVVGQGHVGLLGNSRPVGLAGGRGSGSSS